MSGKCDFSDLPVELKQHILSYLTWGDILSAVSRVSKEVRKLGFNSVERINFEAARKTNQHKLLLPFLSSRTKNLTLSCHEEDLFLQALRSCPNLKALSLFPSDDGSTSSTPDIFLALENHGRSLKRIRLFQIDFAGSSSLAWARRLTSIFLYYCRGLDDHVMAEIGQHCRQLASFTWCGSQPQFSDVGVCAFLDGVRSTIKELQFQGDTLSDASFKKLGECHLLDDLNISRATGVKVDGLCSVTGLTGLRSLVITNHVLPNIILSDDHLKRAFDGEKKKNLEVLILSGIKCLGDAGLAAIARSCPRLTRLDIYYNGVLTDVGVRAVVENCARLRCLFLDRCERVSKDAFGGSPRGVLNSLPDLEYLDFSGMDQEFKEELDGLGIKTRYRFHL